MRKMISLGEATYKKLDDFRDKHESFNDVITRLLILGVVVRDTAKTQLPSHAREVEVTHV